MHCSSSSVVPLPVLSFTSPRFSSSEVVLLIACCIYNTGCCNRCTLQLHYPSALLELCDQWSLQSDNCLHPDLQHKHELPRCYHATSETGASNRISCEAGLSDASRAAVCRRQSGCELQSCTKNSSLHYTQIKEITDGILLDTGAKLCLRTQASIVFS